MRRRESAECGCGYGEESVEHFLLECPKYRTQRRELRMKVGVMDMSVGRLLGGGGILKHVVEYIRGTERMEE